MQGVIAGAFCSWVAFLTLENNISPDGHMYYFWGSGMASYSASVIIGNFKVFLFSYIHTPVSIFFNIGSSLFYVATHYFASTSDPYFYVFATFDQIWGSVKFWISLIITVVIGLYMDICIERFHRF